ncbi:MAG TPA: tetratricopeptide repeat protein, partial [Anaeromyxobacteraceae bacterium]|nr:tetratricopeptide repeat protein [Anaeromyxobacteraceae bacterium]
AAGGAAASTGPADVAKLLSEVEVYVKYGLHPKALDHLKKIFAIQPDHPEALEKAREVHLAAGDVDAAAGAGARLVRSLHAAGEGQRARDELLRLRQIAPGFAVIPELAELVGGDRTDEVSLDTAEVEELTLATDADVEVAGEDVEVSGEDVEVAPGEDDLALSVAGSEGEEIVEDEEPAPAAPPEEEIVEEEPRRPAPPPARSARPAPVTAARPAIAPPPGPPPGAVRPAAKAVSPAKPAAKAAPLAKPAARPAPPPARVPARPPPPPPPPEEEEIDLSDDLEEVDFFVQQGLLEDAREKLEGLAQFYPDHAGVKEKLADLGRREKGGGAVGEPRATPTLIAPAASDESFDIARDLADELGAEAGAVGAEGEDFQFSVEDVFSQFKKGVEQTVGKEDSDTHFDLGIAYREMGLLDAAVEEFETAAKGNNRRKEVDCFTMIGLCRVAQGDVKAALKAFRRALGSDYLNRDAAKALHFEIGAAYEASGDAEAALYFFQKLARIDPAYRDVGAKVKELGGGPGKLPAEFAATRPAPPAAKGAARPAARPAGGARTVGAAPTPAPGSKKNIGYL